MTKNIITWLALRYLLSAFAANFCPPAKGQSYCKTYELLYIFMIEANGSIHSCNYHATRWWYYHRVDRRESEPDNLRWYSLYLSSLSYASYLYFHFTWTSQNLCLSHYQMVKPSLQAGFVTSVISFYRNIFYSDFISKIFRYDYPAYY